MCPQAGREEDREQTLDFRWNFSQNDEFNSFRGGMAPVTVQALAPGGAALFAEFTKAFLRAWEGEA